MESQPSVGNNSRKRTGAGGSKRGGKGNRGQGASQRGMGNRRDQQGGSSSQGTTRSLRSRKVILNETSVTSEARDSGTTLKKSKKITNEPSLQSQESCRDDTPDNSSQSLMNDIGFGNSHSGPLTFTDSNFWAAESILEPPQVIEMQINFHVHAWLHGIVSNRNI